VAPNEYLIAGVAVKAEKSAGGKFYTVTLPNGETCRYLTAAFEKVAVPFTNWSDKEIGNENS